MYILLIDNNVIVARTSMVFIVTSSRVTLTVSTPCWVSLTMLSSLDVRMAISGQFIFILTGKLLITTNICIIFPVDRLLWCVHIMIIRELGNIDLGLSLYPTLAIGCGIWNCLHIYILGITMKWRCLQLHEYSYFNFRFLGVVGHHEQELPIEKMDVSSSGEIIASISHDNRYIISW